MNQEAYECYKNLKAIRRKNEAAKALDGFIKSFNTFEERKQFTEWFFEHEFNGRKIAHELYESVLFPVLIEGYRQAEPLCVKRLADTEQNLFQAPRLHSQLEGRNKRALLRKYLLLSPRDFDARHDLLTAEIASFRYCEHEWPRGILFGSAAATDSECEELVEAIALVKQLDTERNYSEYIHQFEARLKIYREKIRQTGPGI